MLHCGTGASSDGLGRMAARTNPYAMATLGLEAWRLWFEASSVITLRMVVLAQGGPRAEREAWRMVQEKWVANMLLGMDWANGKGGRTPEIAASKTMRHYRTRVSANRRRLTR